MKYSDAKDRFISTWGALGTNWGINGTMARIHALLLSAPEPMSAEEIMEELKISRGNANMNIRALMDWELAFKVIVPGERREFFRAEKDVYKIFIRIVKERRKRELQPVLLALGEMKSIDSSDKSDRAEELRKMLSEIENFTQRADVLSEKLIKAEENKLLTSLLKLLK